MINVRDYIKHDIEWVSNEDSSFTLLGMFEEWEVTYAEVNELHPFLAQTIALQLRHQAENGKLSLVNGYDIEYYLDYLKWGTLELVRTGGQTINILAIDGIEYVDGHPDMMGVSGVMLDVEQEKVDGHDLPLFKESGWTGFAVYKDELESKFPGWEGRWKVGQDLGLPKEELMLHVFDRSLGLAAVPTTRLGAITFE